MRQVEASSKFTTAKQKTYCWHAVVASLRFTALRFNVALRIRPGWVYSLSGPQQGQASGLNCSNARQTVDHKVARSCQVADMIVGLVRAHAGVQMMYVSKLALSVDGMIHAVGAVEIQHNHTHDIIPLRFCP